MVRLDGLRSFKVKDKFAAGVLQSEQDREGLHDLTTSCSKTPQRAVQLAEISCICMLAELLNLLLDVVSFVSPNCSSDLVDGSTYAMLKNSNEVEPPSNHLPMRWLRR